MSDIIFTIQHPAHVHFFRNSIKTLEELGHETHVFVRKKDINSQLLDLYGIDHEVLVKSGQGLLNVALKQVKYEVKLLYKSKNIDPDLMCAIGGFAITHASRILRCRNMIFTDTEHVNESMISRRLLLYNFADRIYTPDCYWDDIGEKQIRYPGYHELAYLHPNWFTPDPDVIDELSISKNERFVVLRLVSWNAIHDMGDSGFDDVEDVVKRLEATGCRILITSESSLPKHMEKYRISVEPHKIHHLLYYADLFIGESPTMASESAVLGTPAIFVSSSRRGYTNELEEKYGLAFTFSDNDRHTRGLKKAVSILEHDDSKRWQKRREKLLNDKIDTTKYIVSQITDVI